MAEEACFCRTRKIKHYVRYRTESPRTRGVVLPSQAIKCDIIMYKEDIKQPYQYSGGEFPAKESHESFTDVCSALRKRNGKAGGWCTHYGLSSHFAI
jgi:hypothetical protein